MGKDKIIVGWREWISVPGLNIKGIKAKIDTGARTSALHAINLKPFEKDGQLKIKFGVYPLQRRNDIVVNCQADVIDHRRVTSSDGQSEMRYIVHASIKLEDLFWPVELSLTNRKSMRFRMLLGRSAISGSVMVDPARSYIMGRKLSKVYSKLKKKRQ
jgi:hypothetical protein